MEEVEPPFADDAPPPPPPPKAKGRKPHAAKNPSTPKILDADPAAPKIYNSCADVLGPAISTVLKNPKPSPGSKKNPKPSPGSNMNPEWYDLYRVMADTGDSLIKSLLIRDDIPKDALRLLEAVLCLRESKDLFFAQGERLTPASALFWIDELKEWAANEELQRR